MSYTFYSVFNINSPVFCCRVKVFALSVSPGWNSLKPVWHMNQSQNSLASDFQFQILLK